MDSSSHFHLSSSVSASFQKEIETYNSQKTSTDAKKVSLERINKLVQNVIKETPSKEIAQEVKDLLKQMKVQPEDNNLWNQIMGEIEGAPSAMLMNPRHMEILYASTELPMELYLKVMEELESTEALQKLETGELSPEESFETALKCGEKVIRLNLSDFQELDQAKLEQLHTACPNLRTLTLSDTPIEGLDLSIFSKLETLDVSNTRINTLDKLPKGLKTLVLSGCISIPPEEFLKLNSFSKLEQLDISKTFIEKLFEPPKNLKELSISDCHHLPAAELQKFGSFDKLEKLNLGVGLFYRITTLDMLPKSLKELDLTNCEGVTAAAIIALTSFENLQVIHLPLVFKEDEEIISPLRNLGKKVV